MTGQFSANGLSHVRGVLPVARVRDLQHQLPGLTGGEAVLETRFGGYQPVGERPPRRERSSPSPLQRDEWLARYHQYEFASASFQIGIVVASSAVITGIVALAWLSGVAGIVGLGFMALGLWAPHALHLTGH